MSTTITPTLIDIETSSDMRGELSPGKRRLYILAGKAIFTVLNPTTGKRFTYQVTRCSDANQKLWFVGVLGGSDNMSDYRYIGCLNGSGVFYTTRKSSYAADVPCVVAFKWMSAHMEDSRVKVWHEGACGRCGRRLTVPGSIESGLGPTCAGKGE